MRALRSDHRRDVQRLSIDADEVAAAGDRISHAILGVFSRLRECDCQGERPQSSRFVRLMRMLRLFGMRVGQFPEVEQLPKIAISEVLWIPR
jgi:hypothetical protein